MKRGMFIICLVANLLLLVVSQAVAQEARIHVGNLKVVPGIAVQEVYDDNIFLGNGSTDPNEIEESDWITHVMPSILFDYAFDGRGGVKLGYQGDLAYYADFNDNDWKRHQGLFSLDYASPGGVLVGIHNGYVDTDDPFGSLEQFNLGIKTKRWNNDLKTRLGYDFSNRFKVIGYFNYYKQDYDEERDYSQDYDENEMGLGIQIRLMPKTWGFVRYHYGERDYFSHPPGTGSTEANDSDFEWQRVNVGLTWDAAAKLTGELNFGYQWKDYDNERDANGDLYDAKDTWIASTAVTYLATPNTNLSLTLVRALRESASDTNEYFEDTTIGINVQHIFFTRFTAMGGFSYQNQDYNLPLANPREDDNYYFNVALNYQIQNWLEAGVGYAYKKKDSNYVENDYTDNQFMVSLSAVY